MLPLLSLLPAAFQLGQGIFQNAEANNLKESQFIPPELRMKRQLAQQQAFSRRAPGTGQAEEQSRRNLATSLSQARRNFGGDAGKMAAISAGAVGQANDATARLQAQGQQFSENAFARMGQADSEIAGVKERNRREYNQTKAELYRASGQNLFNAASNIGSAAIAGVFDGIDPEVKSMANERIRMGKDINSKQAGRGSGGGDPYIKEGRAMKKAARRAQSQTVNNSLQMAQNPLMGMNAGYGNEYQEFLAWKAAQSR